MLKIRQHKQRRVPSLNMTSMPDLIFTVLFFFMIVTHMRRETPLMDIKTPDGKELTKASNRRTMVNLYIGTDKEGIPAIQIGDKIIPKEKVGSVISSMRTGYNDDDAALFTVNIKADKSTPMGIVTDVKQSLRKAGATNIRYNGIEYKE